MQLVYMICADWMDGNFSLPGEMDLTWTHRSCADLFTRVWRGFSLEPDLVDCGFDELHCELADRDIRVLDVIRSPSPTNPEDEDATAVGLLFLAMTVASATNLNFGFFKPMGPRESSYFSTN